MSAQTYDYDITRPAESAGPIELPDFAGEKED